MRKILIFAIVAALLAIPSFAALYEQYKTPFEIERRLGVERVTHYDARMNYPRIDDFVYLEPAQADKFVGVGRGGYAPFYARGSAKLRSSVWANVPYASLELSTKDLQPSDRINAQYEVWLVDDDSGYRLSLGTFTTQFGGIARFNYEAVTYFDPYETIEVTMEPYDDLDVLPGPPVLVAAIPRPHLFYPAPKDSKMYGNVIINN
ncbi:anti-sigma factor [Candidatus Woesearchaeota archaeon]|nr:anti-sigma factor [Candidatus Woesearchaeota archaeon]